MSRWSKTNLPCPCGVSSDAYSIDVNGKGHCFRGDCGKFFRGDKEIKRGERDLEEVEELEGTFTSDFIAHRGISADTFKKYGVRTKINTETNEPVNVAFFYPNGAIKVCKWGVHGSQPGKWHTVGDYSASTLFGKNMFDKGSKRVITITEGEYDALSVYEIIRDETAAVSVRSSASARSDCKAEYDYINSFDKIIINFDSDGPGQEAAKKVASLFDFKKVFNLKLEKHKDANAYREADESKNYYDAWRGVKRYTPDSLLSTMAEFSHALKSKREERLATYPFQQLQSMLHGLHRGEVVVIKAEEGVGKTEVFRAIENHVLKTTKHPIGLIHLEEDNGQTLRAMAGYFSGTAVLHPEAPASDEEVEKILKQIIGDNDNRFVLHSSFDVEDEDAFIDNMRFMVAACECEVIFFDHISWLATGSEDKGDDERKRLDRISQRLKLLCKELGFCLVMISHVNDDGKTRGSRNISKVANTVISLKRDKTDPEERLKTFFMVEKARLIGSKEGPAGFGVYDEDNLMLVDPSALNM